MALNYWDLYIFCSFAFKPPTNISELFEIKMFFHVTLEQEILLHPRYFGPNLLDAVTKKLYSEVLFLLVLIV